MIISVTPARLLRTQVFDKKKAKFPVKKKYFGQFLLVISNMRNVNRKLRRANKVF